LHFSARPFVICAEPTRAACVAATLEAGRPAPFVPGATIMAGLHCGEISTTALPALLHAIDATVSVDDEVVIDAMQRLASPAGDDPKIESGPSGACGVAAVLSYDDVRRENRGASGPRVLTVITEGAPDPAQQACT
jgi:diaminopropionate ammonia-lyase